MGLPPLLCWGYLQFLRSPFSGISPENHLDHIIPASRGQLFAWKVWLPVQLLPEVQIFSKDVKRVAKYKDWITLPFLSLTALSQVISGDNLGKHGLLRQVSRSKSGRPGSSAVIKKLKEMALSWFAHLKNLSLFFSQFPSEAVGPFWTISLVFCRLTLFSFELYVLFKWKESHTKYSWISISLVNFGPNFLTWDLFISHHKSVTSVP